MARLHLALSLSPAATLVAASLLTTSPTFAGPPLAGPALQGPPAGTAPAQDGAPPAAPDAKNRVVTRTDGAYPGLTLYTPLNEQRTLLVDLDGQVVHEWKHDRYPGQSCYLLADGSLVRCARGERNEVFGGGGEGGVIERWSWEGERLWAYDIDDASRLHHHDIALLPNGNVLAIAWELRSEEQAFEAGRHVDALTEAGMWPDCILEIRPEGATGGQVVWEWHVWDHLVQDVRKGRATFGDPRAHPGRLDVNWDVRAPKKSAEELAAEEERLRALGYSGAPRGGQAPAPGADQAGAGARPGSGRSRADWLHTNAIDYDPRTDLILVSLRESGEIWVLDHSTTTAEARGATGGRQGRGGELLWRWGNPALYRAGTAADRQLYGQHDARWLPDGSILVYDNGDGRPEGRYSRVLELTPPIDADGLVARLEPGKPAAPAAARWEYAGTPEARFFSSHISGADRLPNGNTLICVGIEARFLEVTRAGEVVWDLRLPGGERGSRRPGPAGAGGAQPAPGAAPPAPPAGDGGDGKRRPPGARRGPGGPGGYFRATRIGFEHPALVARGIRAPQ